MDRFYENIVICSVMVCFGTLPFSCVLKDCIAISILNPQGCVA